MKPVIKHASVLAFGNGLSRLLGMIFLVALIRIVNVSDYGQFRYLYNVALLFSLLLTGIPISLAKFIGEDSGDRELRKIYLVNSISIIGALYVILLIILRIFYKDYLLLDLLLMAFTIESLYLGFTRGLLNILKLSTFRLLRNIIQLIMVAIILLLSINIGLMEIVVIFSFSYVLSLIILEVHKRELAISFGISRDIINKIIRYTIPVTLGGVGWSALLASNPVIIEHLRGAESVAYYSAGITLMQIFGLLPEAMITLILPKVAAAKEKNKIIRPFVLAVCASVSLNIIVLCLLLIFRERVVILIFSENYIDLLPIIFLLGVGQISLMAHQLFASFWQGLGKPWVPSITISLGCIVNIIASLILTRTHGIWGASLSYAVSTSCSLMLIFIYFMMRRKTIGNT